VRDDAVGVRLAGMLRPLVTGNERMLVIEAGRPRRISPATAALPSGSVLLVDAAQMDAGPGTISWLDLESVGGISASSHTLPLHILVSYLVAELGCQVALIGIQPEQTFADAPLTPQVQAAAQRVVQELLDCLKN